MMPLLMKNGLKKEKKDLNKEEATYYVASPFMLYIAKSFL